MADTSFHLNAYLDFFTNGYNFQKYFEFILEAINVDAEEIDDVQLRSAMQYRYNLVDSVRNWMWVQYNHKWGWGIQGIIFETQCLSEIDYLQDAHSHALHCYNPYSIHIKNYKRTIKIQTSQHINELNPQTLHEATRLMSEESICDVVQYNEQTKTKLLQFLTLHNIKLFLFYIFNCNLQKIRKCNLLLTLFGHNTQMQTERRTDWSLFVGKSFIKVFFDLLTNEQPLINENILPTYPIILQILREQFPLTGDKFQQIHDCLCEYEGYYDFVHPIRQTRLIVILDETFEQFVSDELADNVFSNEFIVRIVRNFAFF